jgi:hypothetical protein
MLRVVAVRLNSCLMRFDTGLAKVLTSKPASLAILENEIGRSQNRAKRRRLQSRLYDI